ncbi:glycosyltransferase family 2 protein [Aquimarina brevivitae]|uniref:Glycosyltransferase involved in cell wall biosynthesis n=1 Tax=Aquimarina brevivitae TaxID=323412 RepID=A0A4Q7PJ94_9FLAO|nr:glycosyltransferase family 2 protein [Aquimarina brevivitae]RZT00348.1 glycosyltransferase involved in cell wall biosynthesis [Aquimarina brevivitae]
MLKLSGVIITFNEEQKIEQCLTSLQDVVDEIIVVDSYSTDKTIEICKKYNAKIVFQEFLGYKEQKNFAITQATYDHIVSLDGDEALSPELKTSIIALKSNWDYDGYFVNRYNNFCGQWINHSDWYPDRKLRVFKKNTGEWKGINPHDSFQLKKGLKAGCLKGDILHWNYLNYSEFNLQTEKFSSISAQSYFKLGKKAPIWKIVFNPTWAFFKAYFLRLGFLDGLNGLIICVQTANITFLKYIKLRELHKKKDNPVMN